MFKKLFSHTIIYGLAPRIVQVVGLIVMPFITPYLTPQDYGIAGVIGSIVLAISVFSNLGLNIVLANSFAKSTLQHKWLWRQVYGFLVLWNIIYALILAVIIIVFLPIEARDNLILILLLNVLPSVLFVPATNICGLYYQLIQKPFPIVVRSVAIGILTVFLNLLFIRYLRMGYMGWFWSGAIAQIINQVSYYIPLNYKYGIKPIFNFKWNTIKKQLKISLPTVPHYYSTYLLNSFDKVIMKFLGVNIDNIGKYNAAGNIGNLFSSVAFAANTAMSPILLQAYKNKDKKSEVKIGFVMMIVFLTGSSIFCLFSKEIIPQIIRTPGLENIYPIVIVLAMAYNFRPMYVVANDKLFFEEKTKALLKITVIASVISVILNIICIYYFGFFAAAVTLFIALMYMGYSGFFIKEFKTGDRANFYPLFWLAITVALTIFVFFAVEFSVIVKIIISVLLLLISLFSLMYVNKK